MMEFSSLPDARRARSRACSSTTCSSTEPTAAPSNGVPRCPPRCGTRLRSSSSAAGESGNPGRYPAHPGRAPVHDHRQERRPRRHLVGEQLPGRPGRHRQPPVLLLLRARPTTGASTTASSRSCVPTSRTSSRSTGSRRTAGSVPRSWRLSGTSRPRAGGSRCSTADGAEEMLEARFVISAVGALNLPICRRFRADESFAGPAFHSAQVARRSRHHGQTLRARREPGRAAFRSPRPSPTGWRRSRSSSAPRNGSSLTCSTTRRCRPARSGRSAICPSTAGGFAS